MAYWHAYLEVQKVSRHACVGVLVAWIWDLGLFVFVHDMKDLVKMGYFTG
jgi:hypothetical protein